MKHQNKEYFIHNRVLATIHLFCHAKTKAVMACCLCKVALYPYIAVLTYNSQGCEFDQQYRRFATDTREERVDEVVGAGHAQEADGERCDEQYAGPHV